MKTLQVLSINRHRLHTDGKGITTLVALAGCGLQCKYCINAEVLKKDTSMRKIQVKDLIKTLYIDHCYFVYSGGGVTFGGGEPLLQGDAIREFVRRCPEEWNITIETSLYAPREQLALLLEEADDEKESQSIRKKIQFIVDIKSMDPNIYKQYTGKDQQLMVKNLRYLLQCVSKEHIVIKVPRIPKYTTKEMVVRSRQQLMNELGVEGEDIRELTYVETCN